jgi:hypothetical protein
MATSLWSSLAVYLQGKAKEGEVKFHSSGINKMTLEFIEKGVTLVFNIYRAKIVMMISYPEYATDDEDAIDPLTEEPRTIITDLDSVRGVIGKLRV